MQKREAIVLRQYEEPYGDGTRVMLDTDGNGRADMQMRIPYTRTMLFYKMLSDELISGTRITFDDDWIVDNEYVLVDYLLSWEGEDILDVFPGKEGLFPAATRRRAAAQQDQRNGR